MKRILNVIQSRAPKGGGAASAVVLVLGCIVTVFALSACQNPASGGPAPKTWTWTDVTPSGSAHNQAWASIASSADGTHLAAAANGGDIWVSTDSGTTWNDATKSGAGHNGQWASIASSADGTHLAVLSGACGVLDGSYSATNGTWAFASVTPLVLQSPPCGSIASSADGTLLESVSAVAVYRDVYSASTGTWNSSSTCLRGTAVASSADGTHLAAAAVGGDIAVSTDSGTTCNDVTSSGGAHNLGWTSIASSSDGTHLAAVGGASSKEGLWTGVYSAANGTWAWTDQTAAGSHYWTSIASSADGTRLAAAAGGGAFWTGIYSATNGGWMWTDQTANGLAAGKKWTSVASSANGTQIVAVVNGGDIWTGAYR